jgi:PBP1b-binding outer membrane lipoprotein LpoB
VLAAALLLAGCSGDKQPAQPTTATSSATAPSTSAAPATPDAGAPPSPTSRQLDGGTCLQLTGAVVNLMSGTSTDDAKAAADTINGFHPPADVQAAVTHFVNTNGLHTTDPDRSQFSRTLNNWVEQQCPVQQSEKKPK